MAVFCDTDMVGSCHQESTAVCALPHGYSVFDTFTCYEISQNKWHKYFNEDKD